MAVLWLLIMKLAARPNKVLLNQESVAITSILNRHSLCLNELPVQRPEQLVYARQSNGRAWFLNNHFSSRFHTRFFAPSFSHTNIFVGTHTERALARTLERAVYRGVSNRHYGGSVYGRSVYGRSVYGRSVYGRSAECLLADDAIKSLYS